MRYVDCVFNRLLAQLYNAGHGSADSKAAQYFILEILKALLKALDAVCLFGFILNALHRGDYFLHAFSAQPYSDIGCLRHWALPLSYLFSCRISGIKGGWLPPLKAVRICHISNSNLYV